MVASHVRATGPMSTDVVASHDASLPSSSVCDVVPKRRGTARDRGGQGMKNHRKRITRSATRTYAASSVHMCEDSPLKGKRDDNVDERDDNVVKPVVSTSLVLSDSEDCEITKCSPKASTRSTGRVQRSSRGGVCEVSQEIGRNEADVRPTKMASVRVSDSEDCEITPVYAEKTGTSTVSVRRDAESEDCEITPNEGKSIRKEKEIIEHIALSLSSPEPAEYIENMEVKISPSPFKSWPSPSRGRDVGVKIAPLRPTVQTYGKRRKVGQDLHLPSMRALGVKTKSPSVSGRSDSEQGDNSSKSWDEEAHAHPERSGEKESESEEDAIRKEECVAPMKPGDARLNAFMMEQRRLWDEVDLLDLEEELN